MQDRFKDNPERYTRFLKIFSEIYGRDAPDVPYEARVSRIRDEVRNSLQGHEDLYERFESFIPENQVELADKMKKA